MAKHTKHTPGPWRISDVHPRNVMSADGLVGLACFIKGYQATDRQREEVAANARLMAAAPDLLEALQQILHDMTYDDDGDIILFSYNEKDSDMDYVDPPSIVLARKAIVKAIG